LQQLQRHKTIYRLSYGQAKEIKLRMLNWASQFSILLFLDSNNYSSPHKKYECLLAVGDRAVELNVNEDCLAQLQQVHDEKRDWLFGHISYDYKNVLEPKLNTSHPYTMGIPLFSFFIPHTVCFIDKEHASLTIESFDDPDAVYADILATSDVVDYEPIPKVSFKSVFNKPGYIDTVSKLRKHIADGDCYEINFCNKGFAADTELEPLQVFNALNTLSPAPFAAYYRLGEHYMMCASPERYLLKAGNKVMSQPMKGTARRDPDPAKDAEIRNALQNNIKERAENVMIVDLVRNDLAHCCEAGSVVVDELFGIHSFPQVHQMVSTVSGALRVGVPFTDTIRHSFPMGSMTGAPKFKVMQLIDNYERSARELFSGSVGYITPAGDFDFNVIIRSLFYNAAGRHLSYQTGGAITFDSDAEQEWDEMRLKAWALERIFA
jgi:para-aminobenzoate synthetase component I